VDFVGNYFYLQQWNNSANQLRFDKVTAKRWIPFYSEHQGWLLHWPLMGGLLWYRKYGPGQIRTLFKPRLCTKYKACPSRTSVLTSHYPFRWNKIAWQLNKYLSVKCITHYFCLSHGANYACPLLYSSAVFSRFLTRLLTCNPVSILIYPRLNHNLLFSSYHAITPSFSYPEWVCRV